MSIVEGAQQRMFAFPAGQAAPQGQLSGTLVWKGQRTTIKRGEIVLFQALSYSHLKAGGLEDF